jgi:hypothetical protein
MFRQIIAVVKKEIDGVKRFNEFRKLALEAVSDGLLSPNELRQLKSAIAELNPPENVAKKLRADIFEQLIGAVPYLVRPLDRWGLADSSKGRK